MPSTDPQYLRRRSCTYPCSCLVQSTLPGPLRDRTGAVDRAVRSFLCSLYSLVHRLSGRLPCNFAIAQHPVFPACCQREDPRRHRITRHNLSTLCQIYGTYLRRKHMPLTMTAPSIPEFGWNRVSCPFSDPRKSTAEMSMPSKTPDRPSELRYCFHLRAMARVVKLCMGGGKRAYDQSVEACRSGRGMLAVGPLPIPIVQRLATLTRCRHTSGPATTIGTDSMMLDISTNAR